MIGAGLAGLRTVERLRHRGYPGRIALLGAERHLPYDRPPLSKQVLRGESGESGLRTAAEYAGLDVDIRLSCHVRELDADRHLIRSADADAPLSYDVLVIATGASPRRIPGLGGRVLRTLDDATDLRAALRPGARLAIVGAGLIGCEVAASARSLGVEVDLVDVLPGPLIRVVGAQVCERVAELHREHGVGLHMGTAATPTEAGHLALADGTVLAPDVVLEAIGAAPETGWLEGSQLRLNDGVVCDATGRAADYVYAVGDVARWDGVRNEHWTNAGAQADQVAAAILGQEPQPPAPAYWWSDQYDIKLQGLGAPAPDDDVHLIAWGPKARTVALYGRDGRLTGAVGFSAAAAVMRLRSDIVAGTPVSDALARLAPLREMEPWSARTASKPVSSGWKIARSVRTRVGGDPLVRRLVVGRGQEVGNPRQMVLPAEPGDRGDQADRRPGGQCPLVDHSLDQVAVGDEVDPHETRPVRDSGGGEHRVDPAADLVDSGVQRGEILQVNSDHRPDRVVHRRRERLCQPADPSKPAHVRGAGLDTHEAYLPARALQRKIYEAGYAGSDWPARYGGQGLTPAHARAFAKEALHYQLPDLGHAGGTTYGPVGQTIIRHASPEFLSRHGPRILAGDELFCQLFSEPSAGSDMAAIMTRADRDGDDWVITGSKIWTSGAHYADYGMCLARTNWDAPKHRGLTWFAVPLRAPGVSVHPIREITGGAEFCQEFLDGVRVSADEVIGEVDAGWTVAQTMLLVERGAGRDDPIHMPAVEPQTIDPSLLRLARAAGRANDPVARQAIAKIHTGEWARSQLGDRIGGLMRAGGKPASGIASYWKLSEGLRAPERARLLMEIGQGVPLVWEPGDDDGDRVAREYLNSRVWSIAGGTNEMQRNAISEQILGLPREPSFDKGKPFSEVVHQARNWTQNSVLPRGTMSYKVIQWTTGVVAREAVIGITGHPDLELTGAWTNSESKDGRDVGELFGLAPVATGSRARRRRSATCCGSCGRARTW